MSPPNRASSGPVRKRTFQRINLLRPAQAKSNTADQRPLPWLDNPKPTSKIQPNIKVKLKTFRLGFGDGQDPASWPPEGYPYRPIVPFLSEPPPWGKRRKSQPSRGSATVHYFEMHGRGPPPDDIGYPGDIYVDLNPRRYCLYYRDLAQWSRYHHWQPKEDGYYGSRRRADPATTRHPLIDNVLLWIYPTGQLVWGVQARCDVPRKAWLITEHIAISRNSWVKKGIKKFSAIIRKLPESDLHSQSGPPLKKRKIAEETEPGSSQSEGSHDANAEQSPVRTSTINAQDSVHPAECNHEISDDATEQNSTSASANIKSEQKNEDVDITLWDGAGPSADAQHSPSGHVLAEHIGTVLESLHDARKAQMAAERERDERDETIRKLETLLRASQDENTHLSAMLKAAEDARLAEKEKYAALKDTLVRTITESQ
ncbi:hypothetical protein PLICRDRAFT_35326 [Plicaturopsis crispa FD-325 SS-3]|nr:hypothetical protein PLICRDRAFT_35326 [Plicaturopsis crispa FD-325 SS-3]